MNFSRWLKKARSDAGFTQAELAEKIRSIAKTKVTHQQIHSWERGDYEPKEPNRSAIHRILGDIEGTQNRRLDESVPHGDTWEQTNEHAEAQAMIQATQRILKLLDEIDDLKRQLSEKDRIIQELTRDVKKK